MVYPKIGLLILKPTPFCNINCAYCYLPNRDIKARMSSGVFARISERLTESNFVGEKIGFVRHAGEPLALPVSYYDELFKKIDLFPSLAEKVTHSIQTNGMLINDAWCEFFRKHHVSVGVSIDGPEFIHDAYRKDRRGRGTLERALKGVECLKRNSVDFHAIAVITSDALDHAEEIFEFFVGIGVEQLGLNIEEKEGTNSSSSLETRDLEGRVRAFFQEMYELQKWHEGKLRIREFDRAFRTIANADAESPAAALELNDQVSPIKILSIDCDGRFSTFSPELLGMNDPEHGDFIFGNVLGDSFDSIWTRQNFVATLDEINKGIARCREECEYFNFCGGGAPSNKLYENGSLDSAETMYCKYTVQFPLDIVLTELESRLLGEPA